MFTDRARRARAIALWAGVSGLGVAIGPVVGGYLLEHFWWGSIFLVNVPVIAVAVVAAFLIVPESRDEHAARLDLVGTALSTVGLVALLYGIIEGPTNGWGAPTTVVAFVVAVVLLTTFVLWERQTDHPILDVIVLREPAVHRRVGRGDAGVLRDVRLAVLRQPVPAVRARLLRAEVRASG